MYFSLAQFGCVFRGNSHNSVTEETSCKYAVPSDAGFALLATGTRGLVLGSALWLGQKQAPEALRHFGEAADSLRRVRTPQRIAANSGLGRGRSSQARGRRFPYARFPTPIDALASVQRDPLTWLGSNRALFAERECVFQFVRKCPLPCLQHGCMLGLLCKRWLTLRRSIRGAL